jgi:hypothetical protein
VNPIGFSPPGLDRLAAVTSLADLDQGWSGASGWLSKLAGDIPVDLAVFGEISDGPGGVLGFGNWDELIGLLRQYLGVVDHPGLHRDVVERARLLSGLAAAGVPLVVSEISEDLETVLGSGLANALRSLSLNDVVGDSFRREQTSVQVRREALRSTSLRSRWNSLSSAAGLQVRALPLVSVIMSTNRPEYAEHALSQVRNQAYPEWEFILVLHGDQFGTGIEDMASRYLGERVRVIRADREVVFGDALNLAVAASEGEFVTKMDDDDWYGSDHLWDLFLAAEFSGADLVGKAAEFVYLGGLDVTIRRLSKGAESSSSLSLAGGTLMASRESFDQLGGWPSVKRSVDRAFIDALVESGGSSYRTHGFGYVLNRHGVAHTWDVSVDYFLQQSEMQRRGLALEMAGVA